VKVQRCQRTPFQVMLHDRELATLMAAAGRAVEGEFRADLQAELRLVVNAHEPHLASLNHGEICRALRVAAPGSGQPGGARTR